MKGNEIDALFKRKLSHQKLPPPPNAWDSIRENLPEKKKKGIVFWASIAASILLLFTLGWRIASIPSPAHKVEKVQPLAKHEVSESAAGQDAVSKPDTPEANNTVLTGTESPKVTTLPRKPKGEPLTKPTKKEPVPVVTTADKAVYKARHEVAIPSLDVRQNLKLQASNITFDFTAVMPFTLTNHYPAGTTPTEVPIKKKKFRMINGLISIAKGVNSGKLAFSELRNAKNEFINKDLKYGQKESDEPSKGDDSDLDKD